MASISVPALPALPPDVRWLLSIPLTRKDLDDYLAPPNPLPAWLPSGVHLQPFSVGNIYTSRFTANDPHQRYDLFLHCKLRLPEEFDVADPAVLTFESRAQQYSFTDFLDPACWAAAHSLLPDLSLLSGPSSLSNAERSILFAGVRRRLLELEQKRLQYVHLVLNDACLYWMRNLAGYGVIAPGNVAAHRVLEPYWQPLPDHNLIVQLFDNKALPQLLLLTARHEIGHLYCVVRAWWDRVYAGRHLHSDHHGLSGEQLGLLAARAHVSTRWLTKPTTAAHDAATRRHDAPTAHGDYPCDLARLYAGFYRWYRAVYSTVVQPAQCQRLYPDGSRCPNPIPTKEGRGRKPLYCSDACRKATRSAQGTRRQRTSRIRHAEIQRAVHR